jgi:hypothetical protein
MQQCFMIVPVAKYIFHADDIVNCMYYILSIPSPLFPLKVCGQNDFARKLFSLQTDVTVLYKRKID